MSRRPSAGAGIGGAGGGGFDGGGGGRDWPRPTCGRALGAVAVLAGPAAQREIQAALRHIQPGIAQGAGQGRRILLQQVQRLRLVGGQMRLALPVASMERRTSTWPSSGGSRRISNCLAPLCDLAAISTASAGRLGLRLRLRRDLNMLSEFSGLCLRRPAGRRGNDDRVRAVGREFRSGRIRCGRRALTVSGLSSVSSVEAAVLVSALFTAAGSLTCCDFPATAWLS